MFNTGRYYVYELRYPMDVMRFGVFAGRVFYVGKGVNGRVDHHEARVRALLKKNRPMLLKHKDKVILSIWDAGGQVVKAIVFRSDSEDEAFEAESNLINYYGLENLTNATYGRKVRNVTTAANSSLPGYTRGQGTRADGEGRGPTQSGWLGDSTPAASPFGLARQVLRLNSDLHPRDAFGYAPGDDNQAHITRQVESTDEGKERT